MSLDLTVLEDFDALDLAETIHELKKWQEQAEFWDDLEYEEDDKPRKPLRNADLLEMAQDYPPSQSWYDENFDG